MQLKDYYTILQLHPSASLDEIKKSFRRLAHEYHPDKTDNDPYAAAQFREIKEAYETLANPVKKDQYLQHRWYAQSMGKRNTGTVLTPETILKQSLELDKYSRTLDVHRMDKEGLYHYICHLVSDDHIEVLNDFNDVSINKEIALSLIKTARLLPHHLVVDLVSRLKKINYSDDSVTEKMNQFVQHSRKSDYWERKKTWIVLVVVILLCLGMYLVSKI